MIAQPTNWNELPSDEVPVTKTNIIKERLITKVRVMRVQYIAPYTDKQGNARGNTIALYLDVIEGNYKGIWGASDINEWSKQGIYYLSLKETESAQKMFKRIITVFEKSNPNYTAFVNGQMDEMSLMNKIAVATIGEEEYEYKGEIKNKFVIRDLRSIQALNNGEIKLPEKKTLNKETKTNNNSVEKPKFEQPSIVSSNDVSDDDLPW